LFHVIDPSSPLYGMTEDDLKAAEAILLLSVHGHDDASSQELFARHAYSHRDIRWRHRYADITSNYDGRLIIDYTKFHETIEDIEARSSSADTM
jgi:inward rectifier potassium channel